MNNKHKNKVHTGLTDDLWNKVNIKNQPELYKRLFSITSVNNWQDIVDFYRNLTKDKTEDKKSDKTWIFRGQENPDWGLMTAIERFSINSLDVKDAYNKLPIIEKELIRLFKRQFHQYSQYVPHNEDNVEWLSYMQHYGTATRFLDCTYSFYVALFFALETAIGDIKENEFRSVWAFNTKWIHDRGTLKFSPEEVKKYKLDNYNHIVTDSKRDNELLFKKPSRTYVQSLNPDKLNERLIIQQGVFLVPHNLRKSFIENFAALAKSREMPQEHLHLILIPNNKQKLKEIIGELHRMNMNSATLFPGLDGFSKHMNRNIFFTEWIKKIRWNNQRDHCDAPEGGA